MSTSSRLLLLAASLAAGEDCYPKDVVLPDWTGMGRCRSIFISGHDKLSPEAIHRFVKRFETAQTFNAQTPHIVVANDGALDDAAAVRLARSLTNNTSVHSLDLTGNGLGDKFAAALGKALSRNHAMKTLTLHDNAIGAEGAEGLAKGLRKNRGLELLDLGRNSIGDAGATAFAGALGDNGALRTLVLASNGIGDAGAGALGSAIEWTKSCRTLDLTANRIGEAGGAALADGVEGNAFLDMVDVGDNDGIAAAEHMRIRMTFKKGRVARGEHVRERRAKEKAEL